MFTRKNLIRTAAVLTLAGGLAAGMAGTSNAKVLGSTPTPTPTYTHPVPQPRPVVRNFTFDLQESFIDGLSLNDVRGRGAILFNRWANDDSIVNPDLSRFAGLGGSLLLRHDSLAGATFDVNRYTCTVDIAQPQGRFILVQRALAQTTSGPQLLHATGLGAGWFVVGHSGQFNLTAQYSWDLVRDHFCPLNFLSDGQIARAITYGRGIANTAASVDFAVQGRARVIRVTAPVIHPFTPVATPSDTASA